MARNKEIRETYFNLLNSSASSCLSPGMSCNKNAIKAHSIQNSKIFDQLAAKGHLIGLQLRTNNSLSPTINFNSIGRNSASTFKGLCSEHDAEIFKPIDNSPFSTGNMEQLFLLAYRSVLKELHTKISESAKLATMFFKNIELGIDSYDSPRFSYFFTYLENSMETREYKSEYDNAFLNKDYDFLSHQIFELPTTKASITCSTLFKNIPYPSIVMNIFPISSQLTYAIFSCKRTEIEGMSEYLHSCINAESFHRNYEVSKIVIRNSENVFINPAFFEQWSEEKKKKILDYFQDTLYHDSDKNDPDYYLFA